MTPKDAAYRPLTFGGPLTAGCVLPWRLGSWQAGLASGRSVEAAHELPSVQGPRDCSSDGIVGSHAPLPQGTGDAQSDAEEEEG